LVAPFAPCALVALVALGAALASGCAASRVGAIAMAPTRFQAVQTPAGQVVEQLDDEVLFREAGRAFEDRDYDAAARKYSLIVSRFPDSRYINVARFNSGLALERAERYAEAVPWFEQVVSHLPGSKDAHDALFRIATCHEKLAQWEQAEEVLTAILAPAWEGIVPVDQLEALARRGRTRHHRGDLAPAERDYLAALKVYRDNLSNRAFRGNYHVSMAQFEIAELYRELFTTIRFKLPLERMARDLDDKANLFLKAQNGYMRTLRHHHPEFAVAAGYKLGAIYEQFYDDMMGAEVPADLSREEVDVYFEELRKKVRPLIVRAIDIYERNIQMGERLGSDGGAWVDKSRAGLARLKQALVAESARELESKLR
jgi:tetratricopeptide (TPR) repeat protein